MVNVTMQYIHLSHLELPLVEHVMILLVYVCTHVYMCVYPYNYVVTCIQLHAVKAE